MPAVFECEFVVRQYECDAFGQLQPVNYVRWMQEAALGATASVGWTMERYAAAGTQWLIRETQVEFLKPVGFGERVRIRTWIDDFRKVRSYRRYEFRRGETLIARAVTDWVYIDLASGKPCAIPPEMINDFRPEGSPPTTPRTAFAAPVVNTPLYSVERRVAWSEVDVQGHANNAAYLGYVDDAFQQGAWGAAAHGLMRPAAQVARVHLQYLLPARFNDRLRVDVFDAAPSAAALHQHYQVRRLADNALIAQANADYALTDSA
jgi:acyl-CoA thioester hydrolase